MHVAAPEVPLGLWRTLDRLAIHFDIMADLKEAVQLARESLSDLIPDATASALEEVEREGQEWFITLSFSRPGLGLLGEFDQQRIYKKFRVVDGSVVSMKIRELSGF